MINAIIESVSIALNAEFGDRYRIHREAVGQGLEEPCFFVSCINPTNKLFLGKRYSRQNLFCIQYFPEKEGGEKEECYDTAERLFSCLEWLAVDGDLVMGTKMKCEVVDGVLHFFVNYDLFVYKAGEAAPVMEEVSSETHEKG